MQRGWYVNQNITGQNKKASGELARHARGNAGNGANIDKHHRQGIFLGVTPLERGREK